jgi:hypothetical protein
MSTDGQGGPELIRLLQALAVAAIVVVVSGGCAEVAAPTGAVETPSAPTPSHQMATPTPNPASTDPADPASWGITSSGIGPVMLGAELGVARAALSHYTEAPAASCANPRVRIFSAPDSPSVWLVLDEAGAHVMGLRLERYAGELNSAIGPRTEEGIGVGSTVHALEAAYTGLAVDASTGPTLYSTVSPDGTWITFSPHLDPDQQTIRVVDLWPGGTLFYELCAS